MNRCGHSNEVRDEWTIHKAHPMNESLQASTHEPNVRHVKHNTAVSLLMNLSSFSPPAPGWLWAVLSADAADVLSLWSERWTSCLSVCLCTLSLPPPPPPHPPPLPHPPPQPLSCFSAFALPAWDFYILSLSACKFLPTSSVLSPSSLSHPLRFSVIVAGVAWRAVAKGQHSRCVFKRWVTWK